MSRLVGLLLLCPLLARPGVAGDPVHDIQAAAIRDGRSDVAHWGPDPSKYVSWSNHTNRLVPVYTFGTLGSGKGIDLQSYTGENSAYRDANRLRDIYGFVPTNTVDPEAVALDQTDLYRLQKAALDAGRKHVILVVFDGMDWQTSRAAALTKSAPLNVEPGRGSGLRFLDETADGTTQFGWMVTSPHNTGTKTDVDNQTLTNPGGTLRGGYDRELAGTRPWSKPTDCELPHR